MNNGLRLCLKTEIRLVNNSKVALLALLSVI